MNENEKFPRDKLSEEDISKISGGAVFSVNCSCCGKAIHYAKHRWGKEVKGFATFCKGYFCDECVEKFCGGKITDKDLLNKFNQLDNRGDPNRYKPY